MRAICFTLLVAVLGVEAHAAQSVRYALIVGNNYGKTPPGLDLPGLKHAEDEAMVLRDKLVQLANFDASPERTVVVAGKTREEILDAAKRLAAVHRRDRVELNNVPTLFAFFFTGHGLAGELLTAGAPLSGRDLATIFSDVGATFTVGVFDACFSGSLDLTTLASKGLRMTPGFNAFDALPQEVIGAEGTMWFVSSQPNQVSYEDDKLGGVFTHYFIEAMEQAPHAGLGVTIEEIWEYARSRTQSHTSRAARPQTPQKLIRNLTSTGPLYFSYPSARSATLAFEPSLVGRFLLRYENGQLSEVIDKREGQPLRVAVYPAEVILERMSGKADDRQHLSLEKGETVWVRQAQRYVARRSIGAKEETLAQKGGRLDGLLLARHVEQLVPIIDGGYVVARSQDLSGASSRCVGGGLRLVYGITDARVGYTLGRQSKTYDTWGYDTVRHTLDLSLGAAFDASRLRLGGALVGRMAWQSIRYDDDTDRQATIPGVGLAADVLVQPFDAPVFLFGRALWVAEYARPVAPLDAKPAWWSGPQGLVGIGVGLPRTR